MDGLRFSSASAQLPRALGAAVGFARRTQAPDGSWTGRVPARALDTGLATLLFDRASLPGPARLGRNYLSSQPPKPAEALSAEERARGLELEGFFHACARSLAVGGGEERGAHAEKLLRALEGCEEGLQRKLLLLFAASVEERVLSWDQAPSSVVNSVVAFATRLDKARDTLKPWAYATWLAIALSYVNERGRREEAARLARELVSLQGAEGSWSFHATVTAFVALPLARLQPDAAGRAARYLAGEQHADGGLAPHVDPVWDTAFLTCALKDLPGGAELVEGGRRYLLAQQCAGSGWPYRPGVEPDYDDTGMVLHALEGSAGLSPAARADAERYLLGGQEGDGAYGTWNKHEEAAPDVVAHAMLGLKGERFEAVRERSARFLLESLERGLWHSPWYFNHAYPIGQCLLALHAHSPSLVGEASRALEHLKRTQNADGGWGFRAGGESCASPTASAVLALSLAGEQEEACAGADWLARHQREDGTWDAHPEVFSPRPVRYCDPVPVHALCVWALKLGLEPLEP